VSTAVSHSDDCYRHQSGYRSFLYYTQRTTSCIQCDIRRPSAIAHCSADYRLALSYSSSHAKTSNSSRDENTRTWRDVFDISSYLFTHLRLSIDNQWTGSSIDTHWNWTWLRRIQYTDVRNADLCWALFTTYWVTSNFMAATVGLAYINLQPEYELPSSTRFGQFQNFGKIWVESTVFPSHP